MAGNGERDGNRKSGIVVDGVGRRLLSERYGRRR